MPRLLVIHHSPTSGTSALSDALVAGARHEDIEGVAVDVREALAWARGEADHETILAADGYLLCTPANFGYMSGALKHVFDSCFLQIGGALSDDGSAAGGQEGTRGRPFGLVVHGRYDTEGAVRSVLSMTQALGWRQSAEVLAPTGGIGTTETAAAFEVGATIASLLSGS